MISQCDELLCLLIHDSGMPFLYDPTLRWRENDFILSLRLRDCKYIDNGDQYRNKIFPLETCISVVGGGGQAESATDSSTS